MRAMFSIVYCVMKQMGTVIKQHYDCNIAYYMLMDNHGDTQILKEEDPIRSYF